ncbi:MAG: CehA/McbA family metallohydrolase [Acidobacteria bacterium]|nr:CehA/McbA family metallohydrolase [Acidobacteriota bacterium]
MRVSLALPALLAAAALAQKPEYPASRHGGNYMHNYYFPPMVSTTPWWPSWSPDGKWIAVSMDGSLWRVEAATGAATELTHGNAYDSSPDWSPDGKWIVYTADHDGRAIQLEILNVATGESHALTSDQHIYTDPVFSPDGTLLAYVSTRPNGYFNVYIRAIREGQWAGEEVAVTSDHNYGKDRLYFGPWDMHTQPCWTRDGKELLIVSNRESPLGAGDLWRVPAERDAMARGRLILKEESLYRTRPDVSPNGKLVLLACSRGAADQYTHLYLAPAAGGEPYKMTFGEFDDFHPRWSPDGERIAYISNEGGLPRLMVLETWGGARRRVAITSRKWRRPMGQVRVHVLDEKGAPAAARIYVVASDGKFYAPHDAYARVAAVRMPYRNRDHVFHTEGEFTLEAPPGRMRIEAVKGLEYRPAAREIEVKAGQIVSATLRLAPLVDMAAKGWYSGSTHVHMNYGGNLRNTLENMMRMARAEDMDVLNILAANKDSRILDLQHFVPGGGEHPVSRQDSRVKLIFGEEFRPPFWGHVFYIGLRDHLISPFTSGYQGSALASLYPSNTDMFRKAVAQGAAVGYVHAYAGEPDPLAGSLGVAKGFPVDAALGTTHALEWSGASRATFRVWHHALNNDLKITPTGGEDSITNLHRQLMVGTVRTYVHTGKSLTAEAWIDGLKQGRTFFTNGPVVEFTVNGKLPGDSIRLPEGGGSVTVSGSVWSFLPLRRIVVHQNGKTLAEIPLAQAPAFTREVRVTGSGWLALMVEGVPEPGAGDTGFPFAGTNAVRVYVGGRPIRNRESAEYFLRWIDKLQAMAEAWPTWGSEAEKRHVFAQFDEARHRYEQLRAEAQQLR